MNHTYIAPPIPILMILALGLALKDSIRVYT